MNKSVITHAIAFLAGGGAVLAVLLLVLWYFQNNPDMVLNRVFPETRSVEAKVILQTTQDLDPSEFIGLDSDEIVDKLTSLDDTQKNGLRRIFESGIRTEVEFVRETGDNSYFYSFYVQDGEAIRPTMKMDGVSVEVLRDEPFVIEKDPISEATISK